MPSAKSSTRRHLPTWAWGALLALAVLILGFWIVHPGYRGDMMMTSYTGDFEESLVPGEKGLMSGGYGGGYAYDNIGYYDPYLDYPSTEEASVIYTSNLEIKVDSVREAVTEVESLVEEFEGFIDSSSVTRMEGYYTGWMTLRIPSEQLKDFLEEVKGLSVYVVNESLDASDVTETIVDLEAQLEMLRTQEQQYTLLLEQAQTVDEVLNVTSYLSSVQYQIQMLESQLTTSETQVNYSTVYLSLVEEVQVSTGLENWSPIRTLREAFNDWLAFLQVAVDAIIYGVLYTWPILLLVLGIWWSRRRR